MRKKTKEFVDIPVREKLETVSSWLTDKKARDLAALDLSGLNTLFEGVIIVTATSLRHGQGLADFVLEESKKAHMEFLHMEGYSVGQWILLDMNDIVVHIFQEDARDLYRLDDLWPKASLVAESRG